MSQDDIPNDFFPYRRLGYRSNPFRTLTCDEWQQVAILNTTLSHALNTSSHILITGSKGRGKTSALHAASLFLTSCGQAVVYEYIPERQHHYNTDLLNAHGAVCIDEVQRCPPHILLRLLIHAKQAGVRLFLSSHVNISIFFRLCRMPLITINIDKMVDPQHFRSVIEQKLQFFALPDTNTVKLSDEVYEWLSDTYGTDIRAMEAMLYDVYRECSCSSNPKVNLITRDMILRLMDSNFPHLYWDGE